MITHLYYPNIGGVEIAAENLMKHFLKRGHNVNLITSRWPNYLPKSEVINGINITRLPFRLPSLNIVSLIKFIVRATECIIRLFFLTKRVNFDVINLHYPCENALYALILSRLKKIPLVTSIHGSDIELFTMKGKFNKWIVCKVLNKSYRIIANSNYLLKVMLRIAGEDLDKKSFVISNGVDLSKVDQTENDIKGLSPFLLGIGRLELFKGFDLLIKAFSIVKQKFPYFKLVIVGDGQERKNLESLSSHLGLEKSVLFCGRLEHNYVMALLKTCEAFIMPSRKEAFGIVNLEAMAARKPVIALNVGGVSEYLEDGKNGLLVQNINPQDLAEAIIFLLESPNLAKEFGENGRKIVEERYNWEIIGDRYLEIFQKVL